MSLMSPLIISMFHIIILKLKKKKEYIKTLGYINITLKADTMENEQSA